MKEWLYFIRHNNNHNLYILQNACEILPIDTSTFERFLDYWEIWELIIENISAMGIDYKIDYKHYKGSHSNCKDTLHI